SELSLHVQRTMSEANEAEALVEQVFDYMTQAELSSAAKVEHTYRLAACLQQCTNEEASQQALQQLLHLYFSNPTAVYDPSRGDTQREQDGQAVEAATDDDELGLSDQLHAVVSAFQSSVLPIRSIGSLTSFEKAAIVQDVVTLVSDPQLIETARKIG